MPFHFYFYRLGCTHREPRPVGRGELHHSYRSRVTTRELSSASIKTCVNSSHYVRTVKGATVVTFYCSRSGATRTPRRWGGASSQPSFLSFERTPPSRAGRAAPRKARRTSRELKTVSIETYENSSHRSAYGGYSSNSKKPSLRSNSIKNISASQKTIAKKQTEQIGLTLGTFL